MSGLDTATWQALGLVLTLLGLGISAYVWSRRGPARGLRSVAWSLIPLAAALTGTLRLVGDVVGAFGRWSSRLVLDPLTWTGIAVAGVSVLLFTVSGRLINRDPGSGRRARVGRRDRAASDPAHAATSSPTPGTLGSRASAPRATAPTAPSPSTGTSGSNGSTGTTGSTGSSAGSPTGDPDMDEIEAILRRRGIT